MVKVFLFESARLGLEFAKNQLNTRKAHKIAWIFPTQQDVAIFTELVAKAKECVCTFTPSQFFNKILNTSALDVKCLPPPYAAFLSDEQYLDDPLCHIDNFFQQQSTEVQTKLKAWLRQSNWTIPSLMGQSTPHLTLDFEKIILYGHFYGKLHNFFLSLLDTLPIPCEWIGFSLNQSYILQQFKDVQLIRSPQLELASAKTVCKFANVHEEIRWVQMQTDAVCILPSQLMPLVSPPTSVASALNKAWIEWINQASVEAFFDYVTLLRNYNYIEKELYTTIHRDLINTAHNCIHYRYEILQKYLRDQRCSWIDKFILPKLAEEGSFDDFLSLIDKALKNHLSLIRDPITLHKTGYPLPLTREQFLSRLKAYLNHDQCIYPSHYVKLETAVSFPFNRYIFSCANYESWGNQTNFLREVVKNLEEHGEKIFVTYSETSSEGNAAAAPLWEANDTASVEERQTLENITVHPHLSRDRLELDPQCIQLSCKAWERLKLAPWQTWLENILNIFPLTDFRSICNKKKILGEWVHQCLQFDKVPSDWPALIRKNLGQQSLALKNLYKDENVQQPCFIHQWLDQATFMCTHIAQQCEYLFNHTQLHTEWPLPKVSGILSGRIDLLVQAEPQASHSVTIVDYKTANNYLFTPSQIKQGKGLQLFLYGQQIQKLGAEDIALTVVTPTRIQTQDYHQLLQKLDGTLAWMEQVKTNGRSLVELKEDLSRLPISFCPIIT